MDCLEKLVACIERFNKGEIDADTFCQIEKQILVDEIQDTEFLNFAVENISELLCDNFLNNQVIFHFISAFDPNSIPSHFNN